MKKIFLALALFYGANSYAAPGIELKSEVFVEVETKKKKKVVKKLMPAKKVVPGSTLVYIISYENKGSQNADNFVINNPLPKEVVYESSDNNGIVSVDGGKTFGSLSKLKIKKAGKSVAATNTDVTHVRWVIAKTIKPKNKGSVKFYARLK